MYWDPAVERRGLGNSIVKLNHVAIIVSDVGRSVHFYVDTLGFQLVRRPNFHRHGAWLTLGNVELHLLKGVPVVPEGSNLVVPHFAVGADDIGAVVQKLTRMGVPFERTVPGGTLKSPVVQYFVRDPDGYMWDLCNCSHLTEFCFGDRRASCSSAASTSAAAAAGGPGGADGVDGYHEGVLHPPLVSLATVSARLIQRAYRARERVEHFEELLAGLDEDALGPPAEEVDPEKWGRLLHRRLVYGDLAQCVEEAELRELLLRAGNHVPTCMLLVAKRARERGHPFQPPSYFRSRDVADVKYRPPVVRLSQCFPAEARGGGGGGESSGGAGGGEEAATTAAAAAAAARC